MHSISTKLGSALLISIFLFCLVSITSSYQELVQTYNSIVSIAAHTQLAQLSGSGSGLVAHYTFDGDADDSEGSNDGSENGSPTYVSGRIGQAVQFDGVNDYVDLGQPSSLDMSSTNAFTISGWMYPTGETIVDSKPVFSRGRTGSSADTTVYGLSRYLFSPRWVAEVSDGTTKIVAISNNGDLTLDTWQHVVVTWNGATKTLTIYKNGMSIASATDASFTTIWDGGGTGVNRNTTMGIIARGKDLSSAFPGSLDDVRIYSRALTANEVSDLYDLDESTPTPGDTTAPTTPANLTATAVSASQINLSWNASTDAVGVTGYTIYRNGSLLTTTSNTSYNSTGLTTNTSYTYTVSAYDAASNDSAQTSGVSATTQAVSLDTTPPTISSIQSSSITTIGATITWTTNESSDTQIEYGLATSYGSNTTLNSSLVTSHSQSLTGLTANTLYHYRVKSRDGANNQAQSSDQTFTTSASVSGGGTCSSVSQYGITWTFDSAHVCGQFVNGDWWVVGPVTITSVSPGWDGQRNGSMLDPVPYSTQSFDSRVNAYYAFSEPNRAKFPLTISTGGTKSLVSSISLAQNKIGGAYDTLDSAAVLTIVDTPPQANSFRPAFVSGTKKIWNKSEVNYGLVPNLPVPAGITLPNVSNIMRRPNLYFGPGVWGTTILPVQNVSDVYPAYEHVETSKLGLILMLNTPQKEEYINRFIQRGIDHYSISLQNREAWEPNGGFAVGLKWPIVFAGILLNDAGMKSPPLYAPNIGNGSNYFKFPEDGYTYLGVPTAQYPAGKPLVGIDYPTRGYSIDNCNSNCMARDPNGILDPEDRPNGGAYRQIFSPPWIGQALAVYLMNAKSIWNHDEYFAYVDRWVSEPENWTDDSDEFKRNTYGYGDSSGFVRVMWNTYRNSTPVTPSTYSITATRSGTGTGTITGTGLSCTLNICTASVANSSSITLTATPSTGSTFTGWSSGCTGTSTCTLSSVGSVIATFALIPDTTLPTVSLTSPSGTISSTVTLSATASDNVGVTSVQFLIDNSLISTLTTAPYSGSWNTVGISNGTHTLTATARDAAGNTKTSNPVTVTVNNNTAPVLSLIGAKSVTTGTTLAFTILATDAQNNPLTYSATSLPQGATFSNRVFTFTPSTTGTYTPRFTVSDGSLTDFEDVTITVTAPLPVDQDSDGDGVANTNDKCPLTPLSLRSEVNIYGCPIPKTTKFTLVPNPSITDISISLSSLDISNAYGKVTYATPVVLYRDQTTYKDQLDIDTNMNIQSNTVSLTSASLPELNKTAIISLYNVTHRTPRIMKDGILCTTCTFVSYVNGTYAFRVTGFSTYTVEETPSTTSGGTTSSGSSGGSGGSSSTGTFTPTVPQISTTGGGMSTTTSSTSPYIGLSLLLRNLYRGITGEDVRTLQRFLAIEGLLTIDIPTTYFGILTETAVKAFQSKNSIVSSGTPYTTGYGSVGPKTRGVINAKIGNTTAPTQVISTPSVLTPITQTLMYEMTNPQVFTLQSYLISKGYLTSQPTGYFGDLTLAAVKKFQCEKLSICSGTPETTGYGVVGGRTRSLLVY